MDKQCPHCGFELNNIENSKNHGNHVRWCDKNPERTNRKQVDWILIQTDLEGGFYTRSEVANKYKISNSYLSFGIRSNKLDYSKWNLKKYIVSDETKKNISKTRKQWLENNPDKHPWKKHSKFRSVPCEKIQQHLIESGINFTTEVSISTERHFSVDILIEKYSTIIEVNGNQHYERDGTLKPYYQERHDYIESLGWEVIELHYSIAFNDKLCGCLINQIKTGQYKNIPFYIKEKKIKAKTRTRKEYVDLKRTAIDDERRKKIELILDSDIDFSKFGWVQETAKKLNIPSQKVSVWFRRSVPKFYEQKCFKRK